MSDSGVQAVQGPRRVWLMGSVFMLTFVGMQWLWQQARGSAIERLVIDQATVGTAVRIITLCNPDAHVWALGSLIRSDQGGINVRNGCEGTEVLFVLVAAIAAYPLRMRWRAFGLVFGTVFVFILNQVRLLALFYTYLHDRALFAHLHGVVAPLGLIAATLLFFALLVRLNERTRQAQPLRGLS